MIAACQCFHKHRTQDSVALFFKKAHKCMMVQMLVVANLESAPPPSATGFGVWFESKEPTEGPFFLF